MFGLWLVFVRVLMYVLPLECAKVCGSESEFAFGWRLACVRAYA
jgi:hypothetical protein